MLQRRHGGTKHPKAPAKGGGGVAAWRARRTLMDQIRGCGERPGEKSWGRGTGKISGDVAGRDGWHVPRKPSEPLWQRWRRSYEQGGKAAAVPG